MPFLDKEIGPSGSFGFVCREYGVFRKFSEVLMSSQAFFTNDLMIKRRVK